MPNPVRQWLKRSDALRRAYQRIAWKRHVFKDWLGTFVWTRTREVVTPQGFRLNAGYHPAYDQMRDGTFEVEETALVDRLIEDVDVFVDVGANVGYFTCLALLHHKPVLAFEPQPRNVQVLLQNVLANGGKTLAEVFPVALSDVSALMPLFGASGPSASLLAGWARYSTRHQQLIPVSTLDRLAAGQLAGRRALIKIDVEGAEYQVLRGALVTLQLNPRPIWLVEVCLQEFHPSGLNPDYLSLFELFWSHGYEAHTATLPPRLVTHADVARWFAARSTDGPGFNYVFADPGVLHAALTRWSEGRR